MELEWQRGRCIRKTVHNHGGLWGIDSDSYSHKARSVAISGSRAFAYNDRAVELEWQRGYGVNDRNDGCVCTHNKKLKTRYSIS